MRLPSLALIVGITSASCAVAADDLCSVAPANCRVLREDAKVRVLEFTARKGDKTPTHSHPAYVVYIVKAGKSRFTFADGTSVERNPKDGEAFINPPVTHSEECLEDQLAILVELKQ
jgi:quercetin dioxygenase-like cupin family protein